MPKPKAKKAKKPPNNARRRDPTPTQIAAACAKIRAARTDQDGVLCEPPHNEIQRTREEPGIRQIAAVDRHRRGGIPSEQPWWVEDD